MDVNRASPHAARSRLPIVRVLLVLAVVVGLILAGRQAAGLIPRFTGWV
ncbi:MAG: hypothetical protein H0T90_06615, partial [Gemmatimonadales bacterium]|nr:hypothetical protein [Gemmatimonadales bacterium]